MRYNDEVKSDTHEIISFLNKQHPEKNLMPENEGDRVKVESYVDDVFSKFGALQYMYLKTLQEQPLYNLYEGTHPAKK
jgi:hypothetical protein